MMGHEGAIIFYWEGGGLSVCGGQNFLGWSEGAEIFLKGHKVGGNFFWGAKIFLRGQRGGGPILFLRWGQFFAPLAHFTFWDSTLFVILTRNSPCWVNMFYQSVNRGKWKFWCMGPRVDITSSFASCYLLTWLQKKNAFCCNETFHLKGQEKIATNLQIHIIKALDIYLMCFTVWVCLSVSECTDWCDSIYTDLATPVYLTQLWQGLNTEQSCRNQG